MQNHHEARVRLQLSPGIEPSQGSPEKDNDFSVTLNTQFRISFHTDRLPFNSLIAWERNCCWTAGATGVWT